MPTSKTEKSAPRPQWGTLQEAADHLRVHQRTIRRMISAGTIKARRFGPRVLRVDMSSLDNVGHGVGGGAE